MPFSLYNSLSRKKETFEPLKPGRVRMYNCGPTVYAYPTIGNWRSFVFADLLRRSLEFGGYAVAQVMNLTDVGHMTMTEAQKAAADNPEITDADDGVDRMEKAAAKENKTVWQIAEHYIEDFRQGLEGLNIMLPQHLPRATDHIAEQIGMIELLIKNGHTYQTEQAIYFSVESFRDYGKLSGQSLEEKQVGVRDEVNVDTDKKHPADFRLWQFADDDRAMIWDSPWGRGFPGWHIECSAMSVHYLSAPFDIHTGGVDHIPVHHENEIAQTEAALGCPMCRVWMHGEFLQVNGGRMGKSLGNAYTLQDIAEKGIDPLALRYFFLNAHYRSKQNFTWQALKSSAKALINLRKLAAEDSQHSGKISTFHTRHFLSALEDDLNLPQALAVTWEVARSQELSAADRVATLKTFDRVLGLGLGEHTADPTQSLNPEQREAILDLIQQREAARNKRDFDSADRLRDELLSKHAVVIEDTPEGTHWTIQS